MRYDEPRLVDSLKKIGFLSFIKNKKDRCLHDLACRFTRVNLGSPWIEHGTFRSSV
jgi:hypothetical protein